MSDGCADSGPTTGEEPGSDDGTAVDRTAELTDSDVSEWLSLEPGEDVEWVGEPTKMRMVGTAVTGVLTIPLLVGIFVLLALPFTYLNIKHTDYVVTNRSLYVKKGILSTNIESVDLDRIQNTEFTQSFWGKQLGFGTIEISTAGSSGADISFADVEDAREVRDEITRVQRAFGGGERGARDGTGGGRGGSDRGASDAQVAELVAELRATREALERVADRFDADGPADGRSDDVAANATGRNRSDGDRAVDTSARTDEPTGTDESTDADWPGGD